MKKVAKPVLEVRRESDIFQIWLLDPGEYCVIFEGSTGHFICHPGLRATASAIYVHQGAHGVSAREENLREPVIWDWVQKYMTAGFKPENDDPDTVKAVSSDV